MRNIIVLFVVLLIFNSCVDREVDELYPLSIDVDLYDILDKSISEGQIIELTNTQTGRLFKLKINKMQSALYIESGIYKASISFINDKHIYSGTINEIRIYKGSITDYTIKIKEGVLSPLIFKELYYSGCKSVSGKAYVADQFIEIYNNSNKAQLLKGLCLTCVDFYNSEAYLPVRQMIWAFPDNVTESVLAPGKSIIIAQDAVNHSNPLLSNSFVDMSKANYETYCDNGKDLDNIDVPNMRLIWPENNKYPDWTLSPFGSAYILFRLPSDYASFLNDKSNMRVFDGKKNKVLCVPKEYVIDAVECVKDEINESKKLNFDLDASYSFVSKVYEGLSIRRKVMDIDEWRVIYMDSNDSANDFIKDNIPTPGIFSSVIEIN